MRVGRVIAVAAASLAGMLVVALHALRRDLSPVADRLSEYATGAYGWLMVAAFWMAAAAVAAYSFVTLRHPDALSRVLGAAGVVAAVGLVVSGMFPAAGRPGAEAVHSAASSLATVILVGVAVARSHWPAPAETRSGLLSGLSLAAAGLAFASPVLHETPWSGAAQRALWLALLGWLVVAALRIRTNAAAVRD